MNNTQKKKCPSTTNAKGKRKTSTLRSVAQNPEKIKAVIQYPGQPASKVVRVNNTKGAICQLIGCKCFTTVKLPSGYIAVYDKDGYRLEKRLSVRIGTKSLPGAVLIVSGSDKHFKGLLTADIQNIREYLLRNFIYIG